MNKRTLITYTLAAIAVIILGALAGWYFFLRSQTTATTALNTARGFNAQTPTGGGFGTTDTGISTSDSAGFGVSGNSAAPVSTTTPPQLWHVTVIPVGGVGFATSTTGSKVRYVERATGYVFEANPTTSGLARLTNSLMPKIYEAYIAGGNRILARYLTADGSISTFAGLVATATTSSSLTGVSLPKNLLAVASDPATPQLFYLQREGSGVAGITAAWDGSKPKQVFSSALSDWRVWWLSDGRIVLTQKPADSLAGYAYTLKAGVLTPLLGPLSGLSILPRTNSSALLYSTSSGGNLALFARMSATTTATRLAITTLADKCAWVPGTALIAYCAVPQTAAPTGFLDAWYRGEMHSADALWRVDVSTGQSQLIFTPATTVSLDVVNPVVDDTGAYIAFMNAADGSPWLLRLNK